jgi:hypothetical protein
MISDGGYMRTTIAQGPLRHRVTCILLHAAVAVACTDPSVVPMTCKLPDGSRVIDDLDLKVGKTDGDGCMNVGGFAFDIAPGPVSAVATWVDPEASLKMEIWKDNFGQLLATRLPASGQRCVALATTTDGNRITVRICHTQDSRVPISPRDNAAAFTSYHLQVGQ